MRLWEMFLGGWILKKILGCLEEESLEKGKCDFGLGILRGVSFYEVVGGVFWRFGILKNIF